MRSFSKLGAFSILSSGIFQSAHALTWGTTKNLFVFGDSYTSTSWNISAGLGFQPQYTAADGANWVMALTTRYNVTNTALYNLAYGGATTDSKLVTPYLPTVESLVDQVTLFKQYLSPPPAAAPWTGSDSLFAIWIGINDVGNSWYWTNTTQAAFHKVIMDRYFQQVDILYAAGARSFLFLNVPPLGRTPLFIEQGATAVQQVGEATADYNSQLASRVQAFISQYNSTSVAKKNGPLGQVKVFDTGKVFNTLLNNANTLGFVNVTGYADAYENGTPGPTTQTYPDPPVSSYFWLNSLHPVWPVHEILAKAIQTFIS
ncbi:hypothetical protein DL93DRAFT_2191230 [Clavulina sp. PMI_390]|nr:hypothetical protein DL93DRAFT_2191230 [Clavulina sp. PMI_390]